MAAFDTPWVDSMSSPARTPGSASTKPGTSINDELPTVASFAPTNNASNGTKQRSTILVQQKSPLLAATPPQITRALAFSHPFILSLNKIVGLLSWSTGDPWESFLLVAAFWAVVIYGDLLVRWAGPAVLVVGMILAMYSRRYSPLSSSGWTGEKVRSNDREVSMRHQKSLDEIVEGLRDFTNKCNILLEPFLQFTEYLSTQTTATSATTRPALTTLFLRIVLVMPVWILFTLPPLRIITSRRVVLSVGTIMLSWHSRPARIARIILWRSLTVRQISSLLTGLTFNTAKPETQQDPLRKKVPPPLPPRNKHQRDAGKGLAESAEVNTPSVRFTFVVYENQRRWLGIGWTSSMLAHDRTPWTDEHLSPAPSKDKFELPEVEGHNARWRWVEGSEWQVETGPKDPSKPSTPGRKEFAESDGWIYYDNKWNDGRRGQDGWGRYTRRRKWFRDAELVDSAPDPESFSTELPGSSPPLHEMRVSSGSEESATSALPEHERKAEGKDEDASSSQLRRRGFLRRRSSASGTSSLRSLAHEDLSYRHPSVGAGEDGDRTWGVGDDVRMGLG